MTIVCLCVQDISGINLLLGVSAKGVTVFCGEGDFLTPLNNFPWSVQRAYVHTFSISRDACTVTVG